MVKVKICGFTTRGDVEDALSLGVEIIGINFCEKSPRCVTPGKAKELLVNLPGGVTSIGVFVNPGEEAIFSGLEALNLSGVQLHGDEPPGLIRKIRDRFPGRIIVKGLRVENGEALLNGLDKYNPDFFLLDAYKKDVPGGTGARIDTAFLKDPRLPWERIFLAGGITPDNVKSLLKEFSPYGIDVASGVESSPGRKDREKMRRLIESIR